MRTFYRTCALTFLVLLFLALSPAAHAQSATASEFEKQTRAWIEQGKLAQIAWTVRYHRNSASQAFEQVLTRHLKDPNLASERWLNTIARAFRLEGMGRPSHRLAAHGYLWPITRWRQTMYEADGAQGEYDLHGVWDR